MIDLHSHLLPGIDDGARTMADAVAMAAAAVEDGIGHCLVTPHMQEGRWDNTAASLQPLFEAFRAELAEQDIPLRVGLSAEVRIGYEVFGWLDSGSVPFLGEFEGRQVILLELPPGQIPPGTEQLIGRLFTEGLQVMIAHPERNAHVLRDLNAIRPFVDMGCLLQLTGGSALGCFGRRVRQRAVEMLELGWVHVLASDAHDLTSRPPRLSEARLVAAEVIGEAESWRLVRERPWEMTRQHFEH